ncbi:MAG: TetR/AcrR family transcriptional regulator [Hydrogenophaga sp.]|jgi:AcrR family transcriptional regulator|uniref:TetR/AcrR family transcriptional regulator n=1 Tax=Hydrogenophaga sp. TaxID=1904254 RepID=UPI0040364D7F
MNVLLHELTPVPSAAQTEAARVQRHQRQQRQAAMSDSRRALVLEAARSVFAEKGVEGASIREIAKRAGYTPGAIYSYFDSKEAIYAALLAESLERLNHTVSNAKPPRPGAALTLAVKARAWFDFYARNPRDLDLGFYLVQGLAPRGLTSELNQQLNGRLHDALRPCEQALQAMGQSAEAALRENTALFAHGVGLLLLQHTGRIRMFGQSPEALFQAYVDHLVARTAPEGDAAARALDQPDLFGG